MITLKELQEKFGYELLDSDEIRAIQKGELNWEGLDGEIVRRKCLRSYPAYLQAVNYNYKMTAYHYSLSANLQHDYEKYKDAYERDPINTAKYGLILLSAPPQTGKSLTITESVQSWLLTKDPTLSILTVGYEATFASRFGRRNRDKFGEFAPLLTHNRLKLHDNIQSTEAWECMRADNFGKWHSTNGGMSTAGMGGPLTGKTGNVIVVDDPIKNMQDAMSDTKIEANIEYYQSAIETRARGNPGSVIIVMCTRWVTDDLIGWLRRHRKEYIIGDYNYASKCTEKNIASDPLKRSLGQGICPEMQLDDKWADDVEESYTASEGSHVYNALYQGDPSEGAGSLYRDDDWQEYEIDKVWIPTEFDRIYLSVDATFKDGDNTDYVGMKIGGIKNGNDYLRYLVRKRMDLPDTLDKIVELCKKFPEIEIIYIEDKANGPGVISVLRKWRRRLGIPEKDFPGVYPIEPEGGKYARAQSAAVYQRDHRCYIPCEKDAHRMSSKDDFEWDDDNYVSYAWCFKRELSVFPYAAHDDLVDAHSQAVLKCIGLLDGTERPEKKPLRFARYSNWWPEMWEDYKQLKDRDEKAEFIRIHGAPKEWERVNKYY